MEISIASIRLDSSCVYKNDANISLINRKGKSNHLPVSVRRSRKIETQKSSGSTHTILIAFTSVVQIDTLFYPPLAFSFCEPRYYSRLLIASSAFRFTVLISNTNTHTARIECEFYRGAGNCVAYRILVI